jgi:putative Mg2+ transporter-C (MgtC) family protein
MEIFNPTDLEFWTKILLAVLCGGIIGLERQMRGKPAGIRTSILICLGTQIFVHAGAHIVGTAVDATRVIGQVVTGIGFLGAGVIMSKEGSVTGITSASVIWILAAIGTMIGLNQFMGAVALAGVCIGILVGVEFLENSFQKLRRGVHRVEIKKRDLHH